MFYYHLLCENGILAFHFEINCGTYVGKFLLFSQVLTVDWIKQNISHQIISASFLSKLKFLYDLKLQECCPACKSENHEETWSMARPPHTTEVIRIWSYAGCWLQTILICSYVKEKDLFIPNISIITQCRGKIQRQGSNEE